MRIVRLRVAGFGPYRAEQTIDLAPFDEAGIFLITGRTGAGKSTILDAVCFALYGSVPRFEGRDLGVRSQHCAPDEETFAELDFTVRGTTYRVRQSPKYERPSRRGGLTTQAATVSLAVREGEAWRTLATKAGEVGALLQEVLPLKRDQFLQVVLLAQGRFQEFLLAPTEKRRQVLRTLFRTERFETLEEALQEWRKELEARAADTDRRLAGHAATIAGQCDIEEPIEPGLEWFETAWVGLGDRVDAAEAATADASAAVQRAEATLLAQESLRTAQGRRDEAVRQLAALASEEPAVQAARAALARAELAERVRPVLDRCAAAARDRDAAAATRTAAEAAWTALGGDGDAGAAADVLLEGIGALEPAIAAEQDLVRRRAAAAELGAALAAAADALGVLDARSAALPAALDDLEPRLTAAGLLAATREERDLRVQELERAAAAAGRASTLAEAALAEAARHSDASAAATRATSEYDSLVHRRLAGSAAELAAALVPGEACAVCGSTEHPFPAPPTEQPVSDADLEEAKGRVDATRRALDAAGEAATAVARALDAARAEAGGRSPAEVADDLDAARARAAEASRAGAEHLALGAERQTLRAELAGVRDALGSARGERDRLAAESAGAESAVRDAERGVEAARNGFPTVGARRDRLRREHEAARTVVRAREALVVAERAAADAAAALGLQVGAAGFADEAEVAAALLTSQERDAALRRVREHDDALARARGTLEEPALADLPAELVDPATARAAAQEARATRDTAIATESAVRDRLGSVTARLDEVRRLLGTGNRVREEYLRVRELAQAVSGSGSNTMRMRLETYVLAAYLEDVLAAANGRLASMTGRRYSLVLDDGRQHRNTETGLGVTVLDAHTGDVRQAASLSGGETFLASLALALGLAEVVSAQAGGVTLDTLFVDEGFGSLDAETLDVALAALEDLRAGGRTIGLISHVESMRERIPAKLAVTVLPGGESAVEPAPALARRAAAQPGAVDC